MRTTSDDVMWPLSPMDAVMNGFGFVILYIFPPPLSLPYDLKKLHLSFISLVEHDYPILTGKLNVESETGAVNVQLYAESRQPGAAANIRFETKVSTSVTTDQAIQERSWDFMPTTRCNTEPISVKGTVLVDGGLAIGVDVSHTLFDGESFFTFMTVWGQHYNGVETSNRLVVNHDRHLLMRKGRPSSMQHPEFRVVEAAAANGDEKEDAAPASAQALPPTAHHLFHFTPSMMKKIKEVAMWNSRAQDEVTVATDTTAAYVSTVDAITALFTVLISRARGHEKDVRITTGVNARQRLDPPLPANYVGNVIFNALSTYSASDLQSNGGNIAEVSPALLGRLARRVRASILQRDATYLSDAISFLTEQSNVAAVKVGTDFFFGPDLMFTSWLHMGMYDAEFSGTHPWYACVPSFPCYDGFVMVTEAQHGGEGIDVGVFLECSAMEKLRAAFREVSYLDD
ncbi:unnamed protein product [Hyaloperonospora brassicae]|uniref:Condensation domain-containing protein n=1 Tax=Hyaloperonospora brassicae TaxID=162125 RepID=A0AAV0V2Y9_HYABA|nr:unnamed protein product [Hyaloperonospora brassicae]